MTRGVKLALSALIVLTAAGVAVLAGVVTGSPTRDDAFTIDRFERHVEVGTDGRLQVVETIEVTFTEPRRANDTLDPGPQTYRLSYTIDGLAFRPAARPDQVQLRIDVPGDAWPVDVAETRLTVTLPAPATFPGDVDAAGFPDHLRRRVRRDDLEAVVRRDHPADGARRTAAATR